MLLRNTFPFPYVSRQHIGETSGYRLILLFCCSNQSSRYYVGICHLWDGTRIIRGYRTSSCDIHDTCERAFNTSAAAGAVWTVLEMGLASCCHQLTASALYWITTNTSTTDPTGPSYSLLYHLLTFSIYQTLAFVTIKIQKKQRTMLNLRAYPLLPVMVIVFIPGFIAVWSA